MKLIKGRPDLRFVVQRNGIVVDDFILEGYTEFEDSYEPVFLTHELFDHTLLRDLKGFRYYARIYFKTVDAEKLLKLGRLLTNIDYDCIKFYPNCIDKPHYWIDVTLADDTIKLATYYLLAQKDFEIKLLSRNLEDSVPLTLEDFVYWNNITQTFNKLTNPFSEWRRKIDVMVRGGCGKVRCSTQGYWFFEDNGPEGVGKIIDVERTGFRTDHTTYWQFIPLPGEGFVFSYWFVNNEPKYVEELTLRITGNVEIEATFEPI